MTTRLMIVVCMLASIGLAMVGCSDTKQGPTVVTPRAPQETPAPINPPLLACGGASLGSVRSKQCAQGEKGFVFESCQQAGWLETAKTCEPDKGPLGCVVPAGKVSFEQNIKPLVAKKCSTCHAGFLEYKAMAANADEAIRRINLLSGDLSRMPRYPNPELLDAERDLFKSWKDAGFPEEAECEPTDNGTAPKNLDFDYVENAILNDLNTLAGQDQLNARYLVLSSKYNVEVNRPGPVSFSAATSDIPKFKRGIDKGLNSLTLEDDLIPMTAVDSRKTVYRLDLEAYDLVQADWDLVLQNDPFKFPANLSSKGRIIAQLTGSAQAWLHGDNFVNVSHGVAAVYYGLLKLPLNVEALRLQLGVDFQGDIDDFDARFLGFFGSPISLNKNRLLSRHESDDGYYWETYDTDLNNKAPQANLFQFPLVGAGTNQFLFDAGEVIFTLPNGLQGYYLSLADGTRADFAPLTIVKDTESGSFDPTIRNALSCSRCHSNGIIPAIDNIRESTIRNAAQFPDRNDVELVKALFAGGAANTALFTADINFLKKKHDALGLIADEADPINFLTDTLRRDQTLEDFCGFVFLPIQECREQLEASAVGRAQLGQLLVGKTVSNAQLIATFPTIIQDFRLGQDPIDRQ